MRAVWDASGGLAGASLVWLAWWLVGIDLQQERGEPTILPVVELCDAFVAMQSGTNCLDFRIASLGLALWLAGTDPQQERGCACGLPPNMMEPAANQAFGGKGKET